MPRFYPPPANTQVPVVHNPNVSPSVCYSSIIGIIKSRTGQMAGNELFVTFHLSTATEKCLLGGGGARGGLGLFLCREDSVW